ncbi:MAG: DNA primase [Candidatus Bathyarchaeia archaeon]
MNRYELPHGMRYSTLEEREEFYREEFNPDKVEGWFGERLKNTVFAVIIGRHTKIYPPEYEEDASTTILIDKYTDISDVKNQILEFRPESAYYDRNIHDEKGRIIGQELAFDLDPENFRCPIHGTLEDKMKRHQGLSFCEIELNMVKEETLRLYEELLGVFSHMRIVYSGRGFHIHVFDADTFNWSYKKRREFARQTKKKGFLIDEWVTSGSMRLIRLPYSLHGMVSRIVTPLDFSELKRFNPVKDEKCIPRFIRASYNELTS